MNVNKLKYPRLLLVTSNAFNQLSGGGITFTNLFKGWPKDKIATVHSDKITPTTDVCDKYYRLGRKEFPWMFPFSLANYFGGQEKFEGVLRTAKNTGKGRSFRADLLKYVQSATQVIFGDEIPTGAVLSQDLKEWIKDFKPDVIYTILGNLQYIRLVRQIAHEFKIPVVIHMMDDWPAVMYKRGIFGPYRRWRMKVELQQVMTEAASCLAICDSMAVAYQERYGRHFEAFHNALESEPWVKKARKDWSRKSPFTIVYAGALMPDSQLGSVKDVADCVASLNKNGLDVEFKIYAPWYFSNAYRDELERGKCVKVFDAPETMDIESLFTSADLLLLPVNFDEASVKYIRYSMPTKVPAYMFSGTPTLAYGPAEVASIGYAEKFQWAYCVTNRDKKELADAIKRLASEEPLRKSLALHAQELAKERHDAVKVRADFHKVLADAAKR